MRIYLAELSHTGNGRSPNVVPLAAGYIAAMISKHCPEIELRIFRDPSRLLEAVSSVKPDIVGLSVRLWSERLSAFCAKAIKEISQEIITVAGGSSIDDIDVEILKFLQNNPDYDLCIPGEGEISFLRLIDYLQTHGRLNRNATIEGCAMLRADGSLNRGSYTMPNIAEIPSPYLNGSLDEFLRDGYEPVIQSMRGCPYKCAFCVSGTSLWNKLRAFDLDHVFEEFEYIKKRSLSEYLILTDENLGILKERDVRIAEYIAASYQRGCYPRRLYFYSAKIITKHVLKVVELLNPIGEFGMSFQTLNQAVKKEIGRTNISYPQFLDYLKWAAERQIMTSTEMIWGFPGETVESYLQGLEQLISSGVNRIYSYNLRLFTGIDLASEENRQKYKFQIMYRLPDRTYGNYQGEFVTEIEEVVVGSKSFDQSDYYKVRRYALFLELCCGRGYFTEFINLLMRLKLPGEKLVEFMASHSFKEFPKILSIVEKYQAASKAELFESPEACIEYNRKIFQSGRTIPDVKLNLIYAGKMILDPVAREELKAVLQEFILESVCSQKELDFLNEYLSQFFNNQVLSFRKNEPLSIRSQTRIDYQKIMQGNFVSVEELLAPNPNAIEYQLHQDAVLFLNGNCLSSIDQDGVIQDIYMVVSRFGLLRSRKSEPALAVV